jgi:hypothetical protein
MQAMKNILLINFLLEGLAGFTLIMMPHMLLMDLGQPPQSIAVSRLYGILALVFAILSYQLYIRFEYTRLYKLVCLLIIAFHFVVSLYFYGLHQQYLTSSPGAFILHLAVSVLCLGLYLKDMNKFTVHE